MTDNVLLITTAKGKALLELAGIAVREIKLNGTVAGAEKERTPAVFPRPYTPRTRLTIGVEPRHSTPAHTVWTIVKKTRGMTIIRRDLNAKLKDSGEKFNFSALISKMLRNGELRSVEELIA